MLRQWFWRFPMVSGPLDPQEVGVRRFLSIAAREPHELKVILRELKLSRDQGHAAGATPFRQRFWRSLRAAAAPRTWC
jgi:hypothetical protein